MLPKWSLTLLALVLSAGLLLQAVLLARLLWRAGCGASVGRVKNCLREALDWARCAFGRKKKKKHEDAEAQRFDELVRKQIDEKRVIYARRCISVMLALSTMTSARNVMMIAGGTFDFVSPGQALVSTFWYLLSLGLVLFPSLTKAHTLHLWHCAFMLLPILWVSPFSGIDVDNLVKTRAGIVLISIFLGILNLNCRISFFTYLLVAAFAILNVGMGDLHFLSLEIMIVFAETAFIYSWETALYEATRRQLEAKSTRGQQVAASSLLGMMCDSVVELGEDLKMVEHSPSLANALFHGTGTSLQGVPLERYITDEEDQAVFRQSMDVNKDELAVAKAEMFHTRLRDSWGNLVHMEAFHIPFLGVDDSMRHLVGLKEPTETPAAAGPQEENAADALACPSATVPAGGEPARPNACLTNSVAVGLADTGRLTAAGRARSRSRRSGSASSQRTGASDANELQLDVVANLELTIAYTTPTLKAKYGSLEKMTELLPEPKEFTRWLNSIADDVFSGAQTPGIKEFASLAMYGGGEIGVGSSESWRIKVNFPSPSRTNADGVIAAPQRSLYKVGVRRCKQKGAGNGTGAVAERQLLSARAGGATSSAISRPVGRVSL